MPTIEIVPQGRPSPYPEVWTWLYTTFNFAVLSEIVSKMILATARRFEGAICKLCAARGLPPQSHSPSACSDMIFR